MYRDLDPATWPAETPLARRPLLRALLTDGFGAEAGDPAEDQPLDLRLSPRELLHVLDADASQTQALEAARAGQQPGHPGPARHRQVADHRQSDRGRGARRQDRAVRRREDGGARGGQAPARPDRARRALPGAAQPARQQEEPARGARADARARRSPARRSERPVRRAGGGAPAVEPHVQVLHRPIGGAGVSPFEAIGRLAGLHGRGPPPAPISLPGSTHWSRAELRERRDQVQASPSGSPSSARRPSIPGAASACRRCCRATARRSAARSRRCASRLALLLKAATKLQEWLGVRPAPPTLAQLGDLIEACCSLAELPAGADGEALRSEVWEQPDGGARGPDRGRRELQPGAQRAAPRGHRGRLVGRPRRRPPGPRRLWRQLVALVQG